MHKEENDKTGCNFNFGHECNSAIGSIIKSRFVETQAVS